MKKSIAAVLLLLSFSSKAQEKIAVTAADYSNNSVEMADVMRSEGKIYVLVGIILLIFIGLLGYLIHTDRKITKLEKSISS